MCIRRIIGKLIKSILMKRMNYEMGLDQVQWQGTLKETRDSSSRSMSLNFFKKKDG